MYRTRTCGDLRLADEGLVITLAGWVQKTRKIVTHLESHTMTQFQVLADGVAAQIHII